MPQTPSRRKGGFFPPFKKTAPPNSRYRPKKSSQKNTSRQAKRLFFCNLQKPTLFRRPNPPIAPKRPNLHLSPFRRPTPYPHPKQAEFAALHGHKAGHLCVRKPPPTDSDGQTRLPNHQQTGNNQAKNAPIVEFQKRYTREKNAFLVGMVGMNGLSYLFKR
ncbi:hypothetical protein ACG2K1_03430 [Neisseria sp. 23W00296]|uniref:hypothetical protein n=1 Tax=unclassified Neisseria TaxID=2623750 RepID=UPI003757A47C